MLLVYHTLVVRHLLVEENLTLGIKTTYLLTLLVAEVVIEILRYGLAGNLCCGETLGRHLRLVHSDILQHFATHIGTHITLCHTRGVVLPACLAILHSTILILIVYLLDLVACGVECVYHVVVHYTHTLRVVFLAKCYLRHIAVERIFRVVPSLSLRHRLRCWRLSRRHHRTHKHHHRRKNQSFHNTQIIRFFYSV